MSAPFPNCPLFSNLVPGAPHRVLVYWRGRGPARGVGWRGAGGNFQTKPARPPPGLLAQADPLRRRGQARRRGTDAVPPPSEGVRGRRRCSAPLLGGGSTGGSWAGRGPRRNPPGERAGGVQRKISFPNEAHGAPRPGSDLPWLPVEGCRGPAPCWGYGGEAPILSGCCSGCYASRAALSRAQPVGSSLSLTGSPMLRRLKWSMSWVASTLPSWTPSWSKLLTFQIRPWKATLFS